MAQVTMFKPTPDGYDITAPGVLLILADAAYGAGSHDTPPSGKAKAEAMICDMLKAATAGGFTQSDILHTLLATSEVSKRVKAMAVAACEAAGNERIGAIFASMRNR